MSVDIDIRTITTSEQRLPKSIERFISEQGHTSQDLMKHILLGHLSVSLLSQDSVARYDLEKAAKYELNIDWLVKQIYQKLEQSDQEIRDEPLWGYQNHNFPPNKYKERLVKNLRFIEMLGLAEIDWNRVTKSYKWAPIVKVYLPRDSTHDTFYHSERTLFHDLTAFISGLWPLKYFIETQEIKLRDAYPT